MLDGFLNRAFSSKCKSVIKATRTRIEVVRRRAEAKQRFLKEDLAKLLANGFDINAYGRTEEFLAGLNLLSCYGFIEYSCDYVVKQLSSMQKQRECPEECREAVASLMFAAARFSDLPELRDLRDLFQERYGSSLECFVNQKFVELLSSKPPVFEKRLQLLKAITSEFSIKWDSRGLEQRMAAPSTVAQALPSKHEPSSVVADKYTSVSKSDRHKETRGLGKDGYRMLNGREGKDFRREEVDLNFCARQGRSSNGMFPTERGESASRRVNGEKLFEARQEVIVAKQELSSKKDDSLLKAVKSGSSSHKKQLDNVGNGNLCEENGISSIHEDENWQALSHRKTKMLPRCEGLPGKNDDISSAYEHMRKFNLTSSKRIDPEEEVYSLKSHQKALLPPPYVKSKNSDIPPPYVKSKDSKHRPSRKSEQERSDCNGYSVEPLSHYTGNEINGSIQRKPDSPGDEGQMVGLGKVQSHTHQTELYYQDDQPLRKPRSVRRKQHKSSSAAHLEDAGAVKKSSSSRRRDNSRKGLQVLFDDEHSRKDDEESMIDKLLLHYSKKPSTYDVKKLRKKFQANASNQIGDDTGEFSHEKRTDGHHLSPENVPTTTRSVSLPREENFPSEPKKVYTRANSFQPDGQAKHVHPKLPNYDDLAARFSAMKGR